MFKNLLLLYKKSAYRIYFIERKGFIKAPHKGMVALQIKRFQGAHEAHYETLNVVKKVLKENGVRFTAHFRGQRVDYKKYDLVITVGGDGTFLEAASKSTGQALLGVNSAPGYSTGSFCVTNAKNFNRIFNRILKKRYSIVPLHRLKLKAPGSSKTVDALNDVLVCHENPAMLSRYIIKIGGRQEDQRSSGLWISTAAGSSGAIHSAGGKILQKTKKIIQYRPRELYPKRSKRYRLSGGVVSAGHHIEVISLMRKGVVYVDGAHAKAPFEYGSTIKIQLSPNPVYTIIPK